METNTKMRRLAIFAVIGLLLTMPVLAQTDKDVNFVLFDLALGHNMLFSKVMDLLHIIKYSLFQLEMKTIEIQLTNNKCSQQPVSFWMPAENIDGGSPYGKLNEIDSMITLLIQSIDVGEANNPGAFGTPPPETVDASDRLIEADDCISLDQFRKAFECKCLAYRENLLGINDNSVSCDLAATPICT